MANLKTKLCANSVCEKSFNYKNPKKRYCCMHCKNQAAYNYRLEVYPWEIEMQKRRNNNIQILEYFWNKKIFIIFKEELRKMGFDFIAAYMYIINVNGSKVFRYGNLGLQMLSETEVKLFEFNK